ncbi:hypothetical protein PG997_005614 [Apiospora hydei]|uniref:F-box domain-containing protein n=1 Tax=Apiospora hydei TaxID=1337664 RepID=A0ABR1WLG0_9PEZI
MPNGHFIGELPRTARWPDSEPSTFPASLEILHIIFGHITAGALAHLLAECPKLRRFTYIEGGPHLFKPPSAVDNCHDPLVEFKSVPAMRREELLPETSSKIGGTPLPDQQP